MKRCRYLTRDECEHEATLEEYACLKNAGAFGSMEIVCNALRYVNGGWKIPVGEFEAAVGRYLKDGCLVFQNFGPVDGRRLPNRFQITVWIHEPDDEDEYDDGTAYAELRLRGTKLIVVSDSHTHDHDLRRYPRQWL